MNKESASKHLGISVRSLQRLVQSQKISVAYKRGRSGKQEAIFDVKELEQYKQDRDIESIKPASLDTNDTALARNDANKFLDILRDAIVPKEKTLKVDIVNKPLLKLDEAAALTGLSSDFLRKSIDTGKLKGKIIGKAYRIKRTDLDEYIEEL
jgi:excisionase family DNA binding protein